MDVNNVENDLQINLIKKPNRNESHILAITEDLDSLGLVAFDQVGVRVKLENYE